MQQAEEDIVDGRFKSYGFSALLTCCCVFWGYVLGLPSAFFRRLSAAIEPVSHPRIFLLLVMLGAQSAFCIILLLSASLLYLTESFQTRISLLVFSFVLSSGLAGCLSGFIQGLCTQEASVKFWNHLSAPLILASLHLLANMYLWYESSTATISFALLLRLLICYSAEVFLCYQGALWGFRNSTRVKNFTPAQSSYKGWPYYNTAPALFGAAANWMVLKDDAERALLIYAHSHMYWGWRSLANSFFLSTTIVCVSGFGILYQCLAHKEFNWTWNVFGGSCITSLSVFLHLVAALFFSSSFHTAVLFWLILCWFFLTLAQATISYLACLFMAYSLARSGVVR